MNAGGWRSNINKFMRGSKFKGNEVPHGRGREGYAGRGGRQRNSSNAVPGSGRGLSGWQVWQLTVRQFPEGKLSSINTHRVKVTLAERRNVDLVHVLYM